MVVTPSAAAGGALTASYEEAVINFLVHFERQAGPACLDAFHCLKLEDTTLIPVRNGEE